MIVMVGSIPRWFCEVCHGPITGGVVVYGRASGRGQFPARQTCCGESCAAIAECTLTVEPTRVGPPRINQPGRSCPCVSTDSIHVEGEIACACVGCDVWATGACRVIG